MLHLCVSLKTLSYLFFSFGSLSFTNVENLFKAEAFIVCEILMQGSGSATQGEISFLSWNSKVQHILASTSYNGTTGV